MLDVNVCHCGNLPQLIRRALFHKGSETWESTLTQPSPRVHGRGDGIVGVCFTSLKQGVNEEAGAWRLAERRRACGILGFGVWVVANLRNVKILRTRPSRFLSPRQNNKQRSDKRKYCHADKNRAEHSNHRTNLGGPNARVFIVLFSPSGA